MEMLKKIGVYTACGLAVIVSIELAYDAWKHIRNEVEKGRSKCSSATAAGTSDGEIAEVIWTNELTHSCKSGRHHGRDSTQDGDRNGADAVVVAECKNRYCAANNIGRIVALVDEARHTIDLAIYTFTSYELGNAVRCAMRRGVVVRIISDREMMSSSGSQIITLGEAGGATRCPGSTSLMHHKFCLIDSPQRAKTVLSRKLSCDVQRAYNAKGILMSGSLNWTALGLGGNWENMLITSNALLVRQFEEEFERMWAAFDPKLLKTTQ